MISPAPCLKIRGLSKTFALRDPWPWSPRRSVQAIKTMDLDLFEGEVLAVVGQSGSGKTTLSRIVLGLESPSEGEVWLDDIRWDNLGEGERQARRVHYQYVPQDAMAALDPQQSALDHVVETLRVLGGRPRNEALREARALLDRLGLGDRSDALPREMSGGEQRRVTLARVLALHPRLVVADEPTSGLDPDRRTEVLQDIVGNLREKSACILVTHDMETARDWCTRAVVMLDGHVIESFDPRSQEPMHPYAKSLFDPWTGPLPGGDLAPSGCPYLPDCTLASTIADSCRGRMPALQLVREGHRVACHALAPEENPP
jgi:ABC-type glutathione transport system ATPase component